VEGVLGSLNESGVPDSLKGEGVVLGSLNESGVLGSLKGEEELGSLI